MDSIGIMKTIAKAYLSNCESSDQEAVYHIMLELNLKRIFPVVHPIKINLPEERVQVFMKKNLVNYQTI